jgi:hypothetical protein
MDDLLTRYYEKSTLLYRRAKARYARYILVVDVGGGLRAQLDKEGVDQFRTLEASRMEVAPEIFDYI